MKRFLILTTTFTMIFLGSLACARTFSTYVADGKGGTYRFGQKYYFPFFLFDHAEHCTPQAAGDLRCTEMEVNVNTMN